MGVTDRMWAPMTDESAVARTITKLEILTHRNNHVTVGTRLFLPKTQVIQRHNQAPYLRYAPIRSDLTRDTQWVGG